MILIMLVMAIVVITAQHINLIHDFMELIMKARPAHPQIFAHQIANTIE